MKNKDVSDEIETIGVEVVAEVLQITARNMRAKVESPELFTLRDLVTLQEKLGFTDKMILLMLENLKREGN